jgi:WXG100 family type VII secretion target
LGLGFEPKGRAGSCRAVRSIAGDGGPQRGTIIPGSLIVEIPMAQAHVDPAELRRFARDLTRFRDELQTLLGGLHSSMRNLEKTWRDQEQRKFAEEFDETTKTLRRFLESAERHVQLLHQRAGHVEEYLQQR